MPPILSIAVPSYNVQQYLRKGLDTYSDPRLANRLEVIVVDDGSTDSTKSIAEEYVGEWPDIFKLVSKENGGHGSAVNAGLEHATGTYFRIIDGDDWANTEELIKLLALLETAETDLVVDVKTEVDMTTGATEVFPFPAYVATNTPIDFDEACAGTDIGSYMMIHTLTARTAFLKEQGVRLLEHTFYVDYEYIVKATFAAHDVTYFDCKVYQYLVGNAAQSVSDANYVKRWDDHTRVTEEMLRYAAEKLPEGLAAPSSGSGAGKPQAAGISDESASDGGHGSARRAAPASELPPRLQYLDEKINLLINTHYNIALIFDSDRKRGRVRASDFKRYLQQHYPQNYRATLKRYYQCLVLHYLGYDSQEKLDRLRSR